MAIAIFLFCPVSLGLFLVCGLSCMGEAATHCLSSRPNNPIPSLSIQAAERGAAAVGANLDLLSVTQVIRVSRDFPSYRHL